MPLFLIHKKKNNCLPFYRSTVKINLYTSLKKISDMRINSHAEKRQRKLILLPSLQKPSKVHWKMGVQINTGQNGIINRAF